jgi:arsenate reductase
MERKRVLFLCTGNSARSQMAEAFLKKYGGEEFEAYSAGLEPKGIHPYAQQVMEEAGISLAGQYSKHVKEYMGKMHFSYLITLCGDADKNCPTVFPDLAQRLHWPIEDPAAFEGTEVERLEKFRKARDQINQRIKNWLKELETK